MSEAEREQMRAKLDGLSRRLDARTHEFRERGELSDLYQSLMDHIERRRDRLQAKLTSAEAHGTAWDVIKIEFERDFSAIFDDLLELDEKLDADQMKRDHK